MNFKDERSLDASALEADQEAYFKDHALGLSSDRTATSSLLAPIQERKVERRVRRRRRMRQGPSSGFPRPSESLSEEQYAKKPATDIFGTRQNVVTENLTDEADRRIAAMTPHERADALQEIHERMSPEMIEFLKARGSKKATENSSTQNRGMRSANAAPNYREFDMDIRPNPMTCEEVGGEDSEILRSGFEDLSVSAAPNSWKADEDAHMAESAEGRLGLQGSGKGDGSDNEQLKLQWMKDATEEVQSQQEMESALEESLQCLGDAQHLRFDLNGRLLTQDEIENLPAHLGLHHHGTSPAAAGYTLGDILVLTRSSVATQRAVAYRMLEHVLKNHREQTIEPLVSSGTLSLAFQKLSTDKNASQLALAMHNRRAYLCAVEEILRPCSVMEWNEIEQDIYFSSLFYSPNGAETADEVVRSLQKTDIVPMLLRFALTSTHEGDIDFAVRALHAARLLVKSCSVAVGGTLVVETNTVLLMELASEREVDPRVSFLACDILATFILFIGWGRGKSSHDVKKLVTEEHLRDVSCHLGWCINGMKDISCESILLATSAVRVLRAALTFDLGTHVVKDVLSSICAMCAEPPQNVDGRDPKFAAATEALLGLEAYAHALYSIAQNCREVTVTKEDTSESSVTEGNGNAEAESNSVEVLAFVREQLSGLVPISLRAANFFADQRLSQFSSLSSAAGHFAGTILSVAPVPITQTVVSSLVNVCVKAARLLSSLTNNGNMDKFCWEKIQVTASTVHAGGRILSKVQLLDFVVKEIVERTFNISILELNPKSDLARQALRTLANSAAEWLANSIHFQPELDFLRYAIQLLPFVADTQVCMDLISRAILNHSLLERVGMKPSKTDADELLKCALGTLADDAEVISSIGQIDSNTKVISFGDIVHSWLSSSYTVDLGSELTYQFFSHGVIEGSSVYRSLILALRGADLSSRALDKAVLKAGKITFGRASTAFMPPFDTKLKSSSAEKRPPLAEGLIRLGTHIAQRGPLSKEGDGLPSLILTTVCRRDADISLRLYLWNECVVNCGGASIFQDAIVFGQDSDYESDCEEDLMLVAYSSAIAEGLLFGARCPSVVQRIICIRICSRLSSGKDLHALSPLISGVERKRQQAQETLLPWCKTFRSEREFSMVRSFLSKH